MVDKSNINRAMNEGQAIGLSLAKRILGDHPIREALNKIDAEMEKALKRRDSIPSVG